MRNDVETLGKIISALPECCFVVDAITGLGTTDLRPDEWGIDILIGGSQKATMIPPGLSFASISEKASRGMEKSKLPRYYFDYGKERKGLAYGWYNCAIGVATLPASLIFGALYQVYGVLAAFGWGAALALIAVILLLGVRRGAKSLAL